MALASAVHFIAAPFICVLWGYERIDIINLIDVPLVLLRLALLIVFVGTGSANLDRCGMHSRHRMPGYVNHAFVGLQVEPGLALRPHLATRESSGDRSPTGFRFCGAERREVGRGSDRALFWSASHSAMRP